MTYELRKHTEKSSYDINEGYKISHINNRGKRPSPGKKLGYTKNEIISAISGWESLYVDIDYSDEFDTIDLDGYSSDEINNFKRKFVAKGNDKLNDKFNIEDIEIIYLVKIVHPKNKKRTFLKTAFLEKKTGKIHLRMAHHHDIDNEEQEKTHKNSIKISIFGNDWKCSWAGLICYPRFWKTLVNKLKKL